MFLYESLNSYFVIDITNCTVLYHKTWLHVSTDFMVILKPLNHIKPNLMLQIAVSVRTRSQSVLSPHK